MAKYWNFYDGFGVCVWSTTFLTGDTAESMKEWWDDWMREEEYVPEIGEVLLEDFNGTGAEL